MTKFLLFALVFVISVYAFRAILTYLKNREVWPLIKEFSEDLQFVGCVKVTNTPSGGRSNINDPHFIIHNPKNLLTLSTRSAAVSYLTGIPYRELWGNGPRKYILAQVKSNFYLWKSQ